MIGDENYVFSAGIRLTFRSFVSYLFRLRRNSPFLLLIKYLFCPRALQSSSEKRQICEGSPAPAEASRRLQNDVTTAQTARKWSRVDPIVAKTTAEFEVRRGA